MYYENNEDVVKILVTQCQNANKQQQQQKPDRSTLAAI